MAQLSQVTGYSECVWPIDPACLLDSWDAMPLDVQERSKALASSTLRRLTGYRVGGCPITVRPCKASCARGYPMPSYYALQGQYAGYTPYINEAGAWVNSCGCKTDCGCAVLCEVELPGPVGEVYAVKVDGSVISPTNYRVDSNRLVWIGAGTCPWPACQDLSKPDSAVGTFSVQYLNAYPVDNLGAYAAGRLAMEFAKACTGSKCALPSNVTSVVRQGITFEVAAGSFPNGYTGIREIDAYIALWNPNNIQRAPRVWSPDLRSSRVVP